MSPTLGRPPSENPKNERLYIRVTAAEKNEIMEYCREKGVTILDLIRHGMRETEK